MENGNSATKMRQLKTADRMAVCPTNSTEWQQTEVHELWDVLNNVCNTSWRNFAMTGYMWTEIEYLWTISTTLYTISSAVYLIILLTAAKCVAVAGPFKILRLIMYSVVTHYSVATWLKETVRPILFCSSANRKFLNLTIIWSPSSNFLYLLSRPSLYVSSTGTTC